jgi:hypothetical protein
MNMDDIAPPLVWILCFTVLAAFMAAVTGYFIAKDSYARTYGKKNACLTSLDCPHCGEAISIALTADDASQTH